MNFARARYVEEGIVRISCTMHKNVVRVCCRRHINIKNYRKNGIRNNSALFRIIENNRMVKVLLSLDACFSHSIFIYTFSPLSRLNIIADRNTNKPDNVRQVCTMYIEHSEHIER